MSNRDIDIDRIVGLRDRGASHGRIAQLTGYAKSTVSKVVKNKKTCQICEKNLGIMKMHRTSGEKNSPMVWWCKQCLNPTIVRTRNDYELAMAGMHALS